MNYQQGLGFDLPDTAYNFAPFRTLDEVTFVKNILKPLYAHPTAKCFYLVTISGRLAILPAYSGIAGTQNGIVYDAMKDGVISDLTSLQVNVLVTISHTYADDSSVTAAIAGRVRNGNNPVNRLEYWEVSKGDRYADIRSRKLYFINPTKYWEAISNEPDIFKFIDFLKLAETCGMSFDQYGTFAGVPVPYSGYDPAMLESYRIQYEDRFIDRLNYHYSSQVNLVMTITRWEDMFTVSRSFNYAVNLLTQIPYRISSSLSATTAQYYPMQLSLRPDIQKCMLKNHAKVYLTLMAGKIYDMAARCWDLMQPNLQLQLHNENLDPGKNPFLIIDLDETQRQGRPVYKNIAKSFAIASVPLQVIPGIGQFSQVVAPASATGYAHSDEIIQSRLQTISLSTGLRVSPDEIGANIPPKQSNLLLWVLAGGAAYLTIKGVTG